MRPLRSDTSARDPGARPVIPLFWRLFVPNASVLAAACVVLIVEPANGRIVALVGGLAIMLALNVVLMRRAFGPLMRLTATMSRVDPLRPGQRVGMDGPASEVTILAAEFNAMLDRIELERRDSARRTAAAEDAERRHVAKELHDEIGQTLTALIMQLGRMRTKGSTPEALGEALATAESALDDVRRLARRLRPEALDELGLIAALTALCTRLSTQTGVVIHRTLPERPPRLSADAQLAVYRIAQESLTNVVRHSGAGEARLELRDGEEGVELTVADSGAGLPEAMPDDGGIRGMRERALLIGGELSVRSPDSGGTVVTLRVPMGEAAT